MALTLEERSYAIGILAQYCGMVPNHGGSDEDKFFSFIEADEKGKQELIKKYINDIIIPLQQKAVTYYAQLLSDSQIKLQQLQESVE